jgi:hypothetical protein
MIVTTAPKLPPTTETLRAQNLALYALFRQTNPYLPPAEKVTAFRINVDEPSANAVVEVSVWVDMPPSITGKVDQ